MDHLETCERLTYCEFFISEVKSDAIANRFKEKYCFSCKEACAIYMVFQAKGNDRIPAELFPNEYDKALQIISGTP